MNSINDGGPAFPVNETIRGMSLRDYFAAAALQGLLASADPSGTDDELARYAYRFADAMLAARKGDA